jgi:hypothetical protein
MLLMLIAGKHWSREPTRHSNRGNGQGKQSTKGAKKSDCDDFVDSWSKHWFSDAECREWHIELGNCRSQIIETNLTTALPRANQKKQTRYVCHVARQLTSNVMGEVRS